MKHISDHPEWADHEAVVYASDRASGLRAVIAIHNRNRGPAAGATRYWRYGSEEDALRDALRLSRAMTYKCALAGVPYGGGKGVIMAGEKTDKRAVLRAYARRVDMLHGAFYTGEDVGMTTADVRLMARETPYIIGTSRRFSRPAYWTAVGVFSAMERVVDRVLHGTLAGRTVAVKGLGKVGFALAEMLCRAGAKIVAADIDPQRVRLLRSICPGATIVSPREIHRARADVYAPCALGGEFTRRTVRELRTPIVCGGANNQLSSPEEGERLFRAGIAYVPDYLVNSGGLVNVIAERNRGGYRESWVADKVRRIGETALRVVAESGRRRKPTSEIADRMAERLFKKRTARRA